MIEATDLLGMERRQLRALLEDGYPIEPEALDDCEYRGVSLGLPSLVEKLTWKKFKKVFHRDPTNGVLRGWNVRIVQDGSDDRYEPMRRSGKPLCFGHFHVVRDPQWLLLDYGAGNNRRLDPIGTLRDPLVALHKGSAELLLGWTYLDVGFAKIPTPSFFSLERDVPLTHVPN